MAKNHLEMFWTFLKEFICNIFFPNSRDFSALAWLKLTKIDTTNIFILPNFGSITSIIAENVKNHVWVLQNHNGLTSFTGKPQKHSPDSSQATRFLKAPVKAVSSRRSTRIPNNRAFLSLSLSLKTNISPKTTSAHQSHWKTHRHTRRK